MTDHDLIRQALNAAYAHQIGAAIRLSSEADLELQSLVHLHVPRLIDALHAVRQMAAEATGPIDPGRLQDVMAAALTTRYTPGGPALNLPAALADPGMWATLLADQCPRCKGDGVIEDEAWRQWHDEEKTMREAWEAGHPGQSWFDSAEYEAHEAPDGPEEFECPQCNGHGSAPTATGEALLRFIRAHLQWVVR